MSNSEGRPTVMTDDVLQKLESAFALDCTDEEACFYAGIAPATLYNYQNQNPEFLERKRALKNSPILLARQELIKGIKGNPDLALKYLERKRKEEFSTRNELTGQDGAQIVFAINPALQPHPYGEQHGEENHQPVQPTQQPNQDPPVPSEVSDSGRGTPVREDSPSDQRSPDAHPDPTEQLSVDSSPAVQPS